MGNPRASCAANNLQRISQAALRDTIRPLTQTTMDGILWSLRDVKSSSQSCYSKLLNKRNFFQDEITPHQQQTTAASYRIANILAKAMIPWQHGKFVKDCLVQSVKILFSERADVLRTVEQMPLSRNTCTRRVEYISDHLAKTIWKKLRRCEAFSVAFRWE